MLEAFPDSDWGRSRADRKSTSGMLCRLESSVVSWGSKKQEVVALSTEAEYISCTATACKIVQFRRVLHDCGVTHTQPMKLWCDNISAIAVAKNLSHHGRTQHSDVRFHFIHGLKTDGVITFGHCCNEDQLEDIFTKPLTIEKHVKFRRQLGLRELQSRGC